MKRFWLIIGIIAALLIGLMAVVFFGLGFYLSPQTNLQKADAIVVISGGQTTTRAEHGIELYKDGWAPNLVFSGAALDDGPSNATVMAQNARDAGVPERAIYIEGDSKTTYQNAIDTKRIIDDNHWHNIILVTSPYHQRRALMTFSHVYGPGYTIQNSSSVDSRWSKRFWYKPGYSMAVTLSELRKILYIDLTGSYQ